MVRLTPGDSSSSSSQATLHAHAAQPFVGVEDWIYFRADAPTTELVERTRWALGKLVERRFDSSERESYRYSKAEARLVDAICEALVQDDRLPPPRRP